MVTKVVNIVLVEPQIPQNTGNIARTCAATGARLHLIRPLGFEIDDKKLKRAGLDYWSLLDITYYDNYRQFEEQNPDAKPLFFTTKSRRIYTDFRLDDNTYLVFGREDKGLPEELLERHKDRTARIPMIEKARSLNLSNSVAVAVFEQLRQQGFAGEFSKQQRFE